ncbi:MAG: tripartite tricarboxylate transporter permease [Rhodocyclaceae bacterium]|nr:tripartite tricarboxylate transporter permease [Rhodocyclaceae bacterium]
MIISGILSVFTFKALALIFGGTVVGIIIGAVPGLTVTMGVALFLPVTFGMSPIEGISLLLGLYIGGTAGGLISAILLKIPGTPASVATTFDGHPMAARGEAGRALSISIVYSFLGGMFSLLVLFFIAPPLASVALQFGPYEYFSIAVFSLTMVAGLSGGSLTKGLIAATLGMSIAFIGMAPITAFPRFTFGFNALDDGIGLLPALIGLFAVSQLLEDAEERNDPGTGTAANYRMKGLGFTMKEFVANTGNFLRSSAIGTGIGILPGLGAAICNLIAYGVAKNRSKEPEKFGTGVMDGIVASETSNSASTGGAMVPLLTLGIPGDNTTAILLGGFMIHGITPGPLLFDSEGALVYGVFTALMVANLFMLFAMFGGMRFFVRILAVPKHILLPVIMALCVVGAYGINNRLFDVWTMLAFGLIGWLMKKAALPVTPLLLGFILGPIIEVNLRRGLMKSHESVMPFVTEPISGVILLLTVLVVGYTALKEYRKFRGEAALAGGQAASA